ncbi:MBL fold metallo-hydrolase RNA specificity domain-containing protein [Sinorhizobium alkalisoli]|uniref:MBL fold metallo-hydrolase RNA specificity domain-containing protein n=1 Tax=Sinorhizobium alkalisoli TaxID=1752398 RepID=UPI00124E081A|nr:MBL fold metallo-hydrolase [Sinorhizobium alkalisoli]QFI69776.1 Metallo-beta-lactamase family protein, RNA-specific [Sinorhizobium alkalisoli]
MPAEPIIRFHGAAGTVTGSCQLLEFGPARILVDCGLFQGAKTEKELNYRSFPFDPSKIDAVILTHAHIDHSGLLPKLVKLGYDGPIFATPATRDLCTVMLPDSAHIQESEVDQRNRRSLRRGRDAVTPIYAAHDAAIAITLFRPVPLGAWQEAAAGIRFRFWNAGHLLGSASVEMEVGAAPSPLRLLFSGDIGPRHKLLQFDATAPSGWHYVVCESTYGDVAREQASDATRRNILRAEVMAATHPNGALIIPSFAVERTQELLTDLVHLMDTGAITRCPIIIDSPLATQASEIFRRHARELENGDALVRAIEARNVRFTETVEQSKALDLMRGFHIVIAASGMCEAGRIRHRLKNWLWRDEGTVLLVGYQAAGTLGRFLEDGASVVRIQGDDIRVRARIRTLDIYSGHADGVELADWVRARQPIRGGVFLVHGEEDALEALRQRLSKFLPEVRLIRPRLDAAFRLGAEGLVEISDATPPRIDPYRAGHTDWHNDFQSLVLDLQDELAKAADDKARGVVLRRLRRALMEEA